MLRCALSLLVVGLMASVTLAKGLDVGDKAPDFKAIGVDGEEYTLEGAMKDAEAVVVCFTCNQCPVAQAYEDRFIAFNKDFEEQKIKFVAINVNPESMDDMKAKAEEKGFNFPYAQDESGESAKAYGAQVTPHLFVVDKEGKVAYIGAFDDNAEEPEKVEEKYLEDAVKAVLKGEEPKKTKTRAVGCGIRIKK